MCRARDPRGPGASRTPDESAASRPAPWPPGPSSRTESLSPITPTWSPTTICSASTGPTPRSSAAASTADDAGVAPAHALDRHGQRLAGRPHHPPPDRHRDRGRGQPPARVRRRLRQPRRPTAPCSTAPCHGLDGHRRRRTGPGPRAAAGEFALRVTGDGNFGIRMGNVSTPFTTIPLRIERGSTPADRLAPDQRRRARCFRRARHRWPSARHATAGTHRVGAGAGGAVLRLLDRRCGLKGALIAGLVWS